MSLLLATALPVSIFAILGIAVAHFFWQRYLDKKEGVQVERVNADEIKTTAPNYYAILPLLPIIGVLILTVNGAYQIYTLLP